MSLSEQQRKFIASCTSAKQLMHALNVANKKGQLGVFDFKEYFAYYDNLQLQKQQKQDILK
jgi:hypothetical protein